MTKYHKIRFLKKKRVKGISLKEGKERSNTVAQKKTTCTKER